MGEVEEAIEKYQGLVPLVYDIETMALEEARPQDMQYAVYLKREADKVIAHHKYKRCLWLARWCASRSFCWLLDPANDELHRSDFYDKWKLRWLELADKFKEAK